MDDMDIYGIDMDAECVSQDFDDVDLFAEHIIQDDDDTDNENDILFY